MNGEKGGDLDLFRGKISGKKKHTQTNNRKNEMSDTCTRLQNAPLFYSISCSIAIAGK
jgi:hypothetical protein